jgi:3-oxocholest-4-en-26-oate---CoA ligase
VQLNLADLFEAVADEVPQREALVCVASAGEPEIRLSYAALDERANRLAHVMAARGIGPGDHVALHLYNGNEYLEAMLAAFKLRAVPVNVNYRYVEAELRYLLDDSDARMVIHEPEFNATIAAIAADLPLLRSTLERGEAYEAALASASPERDFGPRSADDLYVLYTGGTTGMPKGVMWRHEDIYFGAFGGGEHRAPDGSHSVVERVRQGRPRRCLPASPLMHGSAHWMAFSNLYSGGTVVLTRARRLDPVHLLEVLRVEEISFLVLVGDAFARPLADTIAADPERWSLPALTVILSGGAILSPAVKGDLVRLLPSTMVVDGFGASETGGQGQMVAAPDGAAGGHPRFRVGDETTVLDDDHRPLTPGDGRVGWLARRGHIPLGYYKDAGRTSTTFPVVDGVRWAVPGDRASIEADGTVVVYGRGSVSINSGGEKIHPEEVEAALKGHPAIFDAVVVGVPDERWGERVTAVIELRPGAPEPALDELGEHCRRVLAAYKVPRDAVVVDAIERSPSGKADYRWARERAVRRAG